VGGRFLPKVYFLAGVGGTNCFLHSLALAASFGYHDALGYESRRCGIELVLLIVERK
jgi:hypothetical protein